MGQYRKKPVVIEAIQYTGANVQEILEFTNGGAYKNGGKSDYITIQTLEGDLTATTGDWIIKGVKGEFYPCKPDIFEATYEPVPETQNRTSDEETEEEDGEGNGGNHPGKPGNP